MTVRVLDWAIQLFGAAGVSQVFPLRYLAAHRADDAHPRRAG